MVAQEENYQPIKVTDTLDESMSKSDIRKEERTEAKKLSKQEEGARTELEKKKDLLNRFRVGLGNIGFGFGAVTYFSATPTIGFMVIKKRLEIGAGPILLYQRNKYSNGFVQQFFVYGLDIYARGFLYKGIYLQARYDLVNKPSYYDLSRRINVSHFFLGAGYVQPIGKIGYFNVSALFNVMNSKESIFRGTFSDSFPLILDIGFSFGLGGKD